MKKSVNIDMPQKDYQYLKKIFDDYTNRYQYETGIKKFEKYFLRHPNIFNEEMLCKLGLLYDHDALRAQNKKLQRESEKRALKIYRAVLKKLPHSHKAWWGIGRIWWHKKNKRAIFYVQKAYECAKKQGKKGIYTQNVGLVYESLKDYKKAEQWIRKGLLEDKKNWEVYINMVNFYRLTNQFKKSKKYALTGIRLFQKNTTKSFQKTPWGEKIKELFMNSDKPLPKIKKVGRSQKPPRG